MKYDRKDLYSSVQELCSTGLATSFHKQLVKFATVCGVEWTSTPQRLPPQNGAIVRTDSVRTKAYLQNSETCMRNLHW